MTSEPIGIIGVGLLGLALAERLLDRGRRVLGADVDPARLDLLRQAGGDAAADAGAVARACGRVVLSLPTSAIAAGVIGGIGPKPGLLIIDTTTGEPADAEAAGAFLAARGMAYLDATVSGSSAQARVGDVVLMVGGDAGAFAAGRDLLDDLAHATFHVGPVGAGARMKLASNLVLGLNRAALAEGLAFARAQGLDLGVTLDVLRAGAAYSRAMDVKGPKMIAGDFAPQARLSQHRKDVRIILAEARRLGVPTPLSAAHDDLLDRAEAAGLGAADNSAIFRAYDHPADREASR